MNGKDLFLALGQIDEALIAEAEALQPKKKLRLQWTRWVPVAACVCLVAGLAAVWGGALPGKSGGRPEYMTMDALQETTEEQNETIGIFTEGKGMETEDVVTGVVLRVAVQSSQAETVTVLETQTALERWEQTLQKALSGAQPVLEDGTSEAAGVWWRITVTEETGTDVTYVLYPEQALLCVDARWYRLQPEDVRACLTLLDAAA